jgi:hypothetical protein
MRRTASQFTLATIRTFVKQIKNAVDSIALDSFTIYIRNNNIDRQINKNSSDSIALDSFAILHSEQ